MTTPLFVRATSVFYKYFCVSELWVNCVIHVYLTYYLFISKTLSTCVVVIGIISAVGKVWVVSYFSSLFVLIMCVCYVFVFC